MAIHLRFLPAIQYRLSMIIQFNFNNWLFCVHKTNCNDDDWPWLNGKRIFRTKNCFHVIHVFPSQYCLFRCMYNINADVNKNMILTTYVYNYNNNKYNKKPDHPSTNISRDIFSCIIITTPKLDRWKEYIWHNTRRRLGVAYSFIKITVRFLCMWETNVANIKHHIIIIH